MRHSHRHSKNIRSEMFQPTDLTAASRNKYSCSDVVEILFRLDLTLLVSAKPDRDSGISGAKVFKKYLQMKLYMKGEALPKLDRSANERR